jgi:hypothetical protein
MATEAQIIANRSNAKKSTGPRTPKGRALVSRNALKHGLLARQNAISTESQADFDLYRDQFLSELAPESPMESMLADRIVVLSWRLNRTGRIQAQTIDALKSDNKDKPLTKLTQSLFFKHLNQSQTAPSAPPADLPLGRLAIKDFSNSRVLDRLLMYERRIENSLFKTNLEFQRLQLMRKLQNPNTPDQDSEYQLLLGGQL